MRSQIFSFPSDPRLPRSRCANLPVAFSFPLFTHHLWGLLLPLAFVFEYFSVGEQANVETCRSAIRQLVYSQERSRRLQGARSLEQGVGMVRQKVLPLNVSVSSLLRLPVGVYIVTLTRSSGVNHCVAVNVGLKSLLEPPESHVLELSVGALKDCIFRNSEFYSIREIWRLVIHVGHTSKRPRHRRGGKRIKRKREARERCHCLALDLPYERGRYLHTFHRFYF